MVISTRSTDYSQVHKFPHKFWFNYDFYFNLNSHDNPNNSHPMGTMIIIYLGLRKWLRWNWSNHDQVEWQASNILGARFTIHTDLKILSGLEFDRAMIKVIKAGLATVTMITIGDYCIMTPRVLKWDSIHKATACD